ncbi:MULTISPECIES: hypothetical protein [unclassified Streptomyces]|uniref:hypothetical protein n=1 Tax=unclassified Streptomyces TaxID=2593676 RepID=UPI000BACBBA4|nr:hypothetical protein [Streptomyces sp. CLI2509]ASY31750.1 hypothetical protein CAC01_02795 [Streptomyces sp. CLI2509]MYX23836.1 hypothetical protein [Streptomyces sp. SID8380]
MSSSAEAGGPRAALAAALRAAGLPPSVYWIEDAHQPAPLPPDFLYLRRVPGDAGRWETGGYERGRWTPYASHAEEPEACAHLRRLLLG